MQKKLSSPRSSAILLMITLLVLGLNLRPVLAAVGPLLDLIENATGLSSTQASLLTTLPVLLMGVFALCAPFVKNTIGIDAGIRMGAVFIALACLSRMVLTDRLGLIASAAVAGVGIALIQALIPAVIKREFGIHAGRAIGLYTTAIMGGAVLAAASAAPMAALMGWNNALAFWAVPAIVAVVLWTMLTRTSSDHGEKPAVSRSHRFWQRRRAWTLMIYFGIGTGAYTLVLAWLPSFYVTLGETRQTAGMMLAGLTLTEVAAGLAVSVIIGRFADKRLLLAGVLMCLLAGLSCMIVAPRPLAIPAMLLLGVGIGALFPLSMILTLEHMEDPALAGDIAAFVQGGGYIIASMMPLIAGSLRDRFADLTQAWWLMSAGVLVLLAMTVCFSPSSYKLLSREKCAAA